MKGKRYNWKKFPILLIGSVVLVFFSCSVKSPTRSGDQDQAPVQMKVHFITEVSLETISKLVLTVSGEGMDTIRRDLSLNNSFFEDTLEIPVGVKRVFVLNAKDASNKTLYSGSDTVDITAGIANLVQIEMKPAVLMIKITPRYQKVSGGDIFDVEVEVYRVSNLFGTSFRVQFNRALLRCEAVSSAGSKNVLGSGSQIVFLGIPDSDYAAVGITRKEGDSAVNGSGTLARIRFRALSPGKAALKFSPNTLKLQDSDGNNIPGFDDLVIEEATVEIEGTSPKLDIYADFSKSTIETHNISISQSANFVYNSYYGGSWKMLSDGAWMRGVFTIAQIPNSVTLEVTHLSSYYAGCPDSGYSPVTITVNEAIVVYNYSPPSHSYITDQWNITNKLKIGENQIWIVGEDLCTHYWIQRFEIR